MSLVKLNTVQEALRTDMTVNKTLKKYISGVHSRTVDMSHIKKEHYAMKESMTDYHEKQSSYYKHIQAIQNYIDDKMDDQSLYDDFLPKENRKLRNGLIDDAPTFAKQILESQLVSLLDDINNRYNIKNTDEQVQLKISIMKT